MKYGVMFEMLAKEGGYWCVDKYSRWMFRTLDNAVDFFNGCDARGEFVAWREFGGRVVNVGYCYTLYRTEDGGETVEVLDESRYTWDDYAKEI